MTKLLMFLAALTLAPASVQAAEERMTDEVSGIEFIRIPAGCFAMGADAAGELQSGLPIRVPGIDEVPRHEVCVDSFWLGRSEVTRGQWFRVMESAVSGVRKPMAEVSWNDAVKFTQTLSAKGKGRVRLPTEAEWEYACHAGNVVPATQPLGEDRIAQLEDTALKAWYRFMAGRDPVSAHVMTKKANAWGLHDMLGNVWEWTSDGYDETAYARHARKNPVVVPQDERRVIRGGSYKTDIARVRCGARSFAPAEERLSVIGFRVVREVDAPSKER